MDEEKYDFTDRELDLRDIWTRLKHDSTTPKEALLDLLELLIEDEQPT